MYFASDNWAGAAPQIAEAITREASRYGKAYGESPVDSAAQDRFSEIFEREVSVLPVATGSAANALALACVNRPGGVVFCHRDSHIVEDECGGVEYLTGGARLYGIGGAGGKIGPESLTRAMARFAPDNIHAGQAMAVSITQLTEAGTAYSVEDIRAISAVAEERGLPVHMDGARFANALVHLDATPAEMTWKAGVDILSFGATKNGCMAAEALIFFDPRRAREAAYLRKRAGQLFSKSRFIAVQFEAYLADGLWLDLARHANSMAERLRAGIGATSHARPAWRTDGNETFAVMRKRDAERLRQAGAIFYDWPVPDGGDLEVVADETLVRLVTSFATKPQDVDEFLRLLNLK